MSERREERERNRHGRAPEKCRWPVFAQRWIEGGVATVLLASFGAGAWTSHPRSTGAPAEPFVACRWETDATSGRGVVREQKSYASAAEAQQFCVEHGPRCTVEVAQASVPHHFGTGLSPHLVVSGRDGFSSPGKVLTPTQLLASQAYDHGRFPVEGVDTGLDEPVVTSALGVRADGVATRVRYASAPYDVPLTRANVESAVRRAAAYLDRHLDETGRFAYLVDGTSGRSLGGYLWARHAGTTFFLAQAAAQFPDDAGLPWIAVRGLIGLREHGVLSCGAHRCVGAGNEGVVGVGATALAVVALAEFESAHLPITDAPLRHELLEFLASQRLTDGRPAHQYDREKGTVIASQLPYYDGEVALAFARSYALDHDPALAEFALALLEKSVHDAPSGYARLFFPGEEHWTCQAMEALPTSFLERLNAIYTYCRAWHQSQQTQQFSKGESPWQVEGAFGPTSVVLPRITPAASRSEAAGATLAFARRSEIPSPELQAQLDEAVHFLLREQLPGRHRAYLGDAAAVDGGFPASPVDLRVQIDYVQHAGSSLLRWLALNAGERPTTKSPREDEAPR